MSEYATFELAREIALSLPGVRITAESYSTSALHFGKKFIGRLYDADIMMLRMDKNERAMLLESAPETYSITDHFVGHPYIEIRLSKIHPDALRQHIEDAWRLVASKRLITLYDSGGEYPPAAFKKLLVVAAEFPGIEEGLSWGTPGLFVGKADIARLKEDNESLVIGMDEAERDLLIQTEPDIYYMTDHYAGTSLVLIRLSKIEPADLRRHVEHVWRQAASPELIAAYEAGKRA